MQGSNLRPPACKLSFHLSAYAESDVCVCVSRQLLGILGRVGKYLFNGLFNAKTMCPIFLSHCPTVWDTYMGHLNYYYIYYLDYLLGECPTFRRCARKPKCPGGQLKIERTVREERAAAGYGAACALKGKRTVAARIKTSYRPTGLKI